MAKDTNFVKQDPDYDEVIATPESFRRKDEEKSNRDNSIKRIREILEKHFNEEIQVKEEEVLNIEKKISQTRIMLDQLRAYLLANYYGCNGKLIKGKHYERKKRGRKNNDLKAKKRFCSENLSQTEKSTAKDSGLSDSSYLDKEKLFFNDHKKQPDDVNEKQKTDSIGDMSKSENRFYTKKHIIVGNVSKFIPLEKRDKNDQATHKWMVYVRGPPGEPDISSFVQKVWFILHPSYMPNDIVEVSKPPFTVTRRGWGEFPVRIQLAFDDPRNKPVDIIHNLKLDKTYTGLQTLGAETTVAIQLQRHTVSGKECLKATGNDVNLMGYSHSYGMNHVSQAMVETNWKSTINKPIVVEEGLSDLINEKSFTSKGDTPVHKKLMELRRDILGDKIEGRLSSGASSMTSESDVPHSEPSSCISSPIPMKEEAGKFDYFVEEALIKSICQFPLILANRDITKLHYCAKTIRQYSNWSFSKRRAAEWQRALDVKRFLIKNGIPDDLTTKDVMLWCRKHGFTPSENKTAVVALEDLDFCPKCGKCFPDNRHGIEVTEEPKIVNKWCRSCLSDLTIKSTSTLSSFDEILCNVSSQEIRLSNLTENKRLVEESPESDIDVVGEGIIQTEEEHEHIIDISKLQLVAPSLLTDWIFEAAAQIEVDLKSVSINGCKAPILQQLLLEAMKSFIRDILAQSYAHAKNDNSTLEPVVVTPLHVLQALNSIPHTDFLTNKYLGIEEEDGKV